MALRVGLFALVCVLVAPTAASAQAADALVARHADLQRELARPASDAREQRLVRLLDRTIDYAMIVRRVLVVHWADRSEAQREEARELLTRAIRHRYRASVQALSGWDVTVASEAPQGVGRRVLTDARREGETREVGYDLYRAEDEWRVVDLRVEGDSLVHQYRVQFDRLIQREGWDGFIRRLRHRVEVEGS